MIYEYQARLDRVIDGDTLDLQVDLGFDVSLDLRVRLSGIDTAEIHFVSKDSDEYQAGMEQKAFVEDWLTAACEGVDDDEWPLLIETEKDRRGKYGRYLCTVIRYSDGETLNDALLDEFGEAVIY